jgi:hypothetical protein
MMAYSTREAMFMTNLTAVYVELNRNSVSGTDQG